VRRDARWHHPREYQGGREEETGEGLGPAEDGCSLLKQPGGTWQHRPSPGKGAQVGERTRGCASRESSREEGRKEWEGGSDRRRTVAV
jgi:hypothetical protein